jgi:hypothetical protein
MHLMLIRHYDDINKTHYFVVKVCKLSLGNLSPCLLLLLPLVLVVLVIEVHARQGEYDQGLDERRGGQVARHGDGEAARCAAVLLKRRPPYRRIYFPAAEILAQLVKYVHTFIDVRCVSRSLFLLRYAPSNDKVNVLQGLLCGC